jgi:hypothetical protein
MHNIVLLPVRLWEAGDKNDDRMISTSIDWVKKRLPYLDIKLDTDADARPRLSPADLRISQILTLKLFTGPRISTLHGAQSLSRY